MTTYTYAQLETLWINAGGSKTLAPLAAGIGIVESGGNSKAFNLSGASGIWQIEIPLHSNLVPGGAGNVFNPDANAKAAVKLSGNTVAGLTQNWIVDEPAGAAAAIVKKNKGTLPASLTGSSSSSGDGSSPALGLGAGLSAGASAIPGFGFLPSAITNITGAGQTIGDIATGIAGITNDLNTVIRFMSALFRPNMWLRVGAFVMGIFLLIAGFYFMLKSIGVSGPSTIPVPIPV